MTVTVELSPGVSDGTDCSNLLRDRIKTFVGLSVFIEIAPHGSIPASQGKQKHVFDERVRA